MIRIRIIPTLILVALAGCATSAPPDQISGELFYRHASDPVRQIRFANLVDWRPVGSEAVLVRFEAHRYYLFEVTGACHIDLRHSHRLSLRNQTPNQINTFDSIVLDGQQCRIKEIRPVDYEAVQAELKSGEERAGPRRTGVSGD